MNKRITVALAGNPNSGKTTIFNTITGSRQHVGNYPGVTVERKEGVRTHKGNQLRITDLPGMYDLTPESPDERVASEHLVMSNPDVVVGIIDCTNLERNLYLAVQLRELGSPLVLAFNMSDQAAEQGIKFDLDSLSAALGVPIVLTVGHKGAGIGELLDAVVDVARRNDEHRALFVDYGDHVEDEVAGIEEVMVKNNGHMPKHQRRWRALKLFENDPFVIETSSSPEVDAALQAALERLRSKTIADPMVSITSRRYDFISGLCGEAVVMPEARQGGRSSRADKILTHNLFGLPIFFGMMFLVFQLTFTLANPIADRIELLFGWLGGQLILLWPSGASSPLMSLVVDGIIGGVGGVIVFLPNIVMLFMAISILEDSGYMARAAFLMDRLMSKAGLHGKSFIPMLLGFGCSVPAIMATRTLDTRRDRFTTMLVVPLMSCSARLTIFALIIPAFFAPKWQGPVLWIMYLIGIVLAISVANILRSTLFKGEPSAFLMELPSYRMPSPRSILTHMWSRAWLYLRKAGTVILGVSIVLWAMAAFPRHPGLDAGTAAGPSAFAGGTEVTAEDARQTEQLSYSIVGRIGHVMEPLIRPMGFDWKIGTALVGAFAAKEVFVAQMAIVYSVGESEGGSEALRGKLRAEYPPLVGFCILLFALIATPCMATVAIVRRESNSWNWALFQFGGLTALGYVLTTAVYQIGRLLGIGI